eukprot:Em0022g555a
MGAAMTATEFTTAAKLCLSFALPSVSTGVVMLLDTENNELAYFKEDKEVKHLPKKGIVWDAVRQRTLEVRRLPVPDDDPIRTVVPNLVQGSGQVFVIVPVVDQRRSSYRVLVLLLAVCDEPSEVHFERLRLLERNAMVAAARVLAHETSEKERATVENMLEVCGDLIDLDIVSLSIKILKHIMSIVNPSVCTLFVHEDSTQELVAYAYNGVALDTEMRKPVVESIYGECFTMGQVLNISNVQQDLRFNPRIDTIKDYEPTHLLCVPVKDRGAQGTQKVIGVLVVCDKKNDRSFTKRDEEGLLYSLHFCSSMLNNTLVYQRELALKKQNEVLLQVAKNLFTSLDNISSLLREIMNEARRLTNAERCSLFLLDNSKNNLVATVFNSDLLKEGTLTIKVGQGIAGYVAQTGRSVNITDAQKHPQFFKEVDKSTGFFTKHILCFPILDSSGAVVGVAQLCNKINGKFFTKYDEELANTFSVYCGISIYHSKLYSAVVASQSRSSLATELMLYHMKVQPEEIEKIRRSSLPHTSSFHPDMCKMTFSPKILLKANDDTVVAVMSMLNEMDLINKFQLHPDTLGRFIIMVKKGYRDPPYHNWMHAFSVAHFLFALYCCSNKLSCLDDLEVLALFVSCLCHDIDHRGTNNAFQVCSKSPLAALYTSEGSVMERHHLAQTLCILNSPGCNIFENFSDSDYKRIVGTIQNNILDTDIATHLKKLKFIKEMASCGYDRSNPEHHRLMCSLIMTSCDLTSSCKTWESSRAISDLIYQEFFSQGDLEKALGITPIEMMDRDRANIAEQQLRFLDGIAGPAFQLLSQLIPESAEAYHALQDNREQWAALKATGKRFSIDITTDANRLPTHVE